jgi:osmoprotectant transport system ATP-binding protein
MIEARAVSKRFGDRQALAPTDLTIPRGQTVVLIGPSGCGKSTLLRLIIGLLWSETGEVQIDGEKLEPSNVMRMRRRMGYVIQDGGLFPHLTAEENACLMARHLRWDGVRIAKRIEELRDLTRLPPDSLSRYPVEISGGQRQRVSLMRALMLDPDILLLDEPLGALDPMIRAELQTDLRAIFQTLRKTVVMVTHDLAEAAFFADVIVLLRDGRILQSGTLDDFIAKPADPFVTRFVRAQRGPVSIKETSKP